MRHHWPAVDRRRCVDFGERRSTVARCLRRPRERRRCRRRPVRSRLPCLSSYVLAVRRLACGGDPSAPRVGLLNQSQDFGVGEPRTNVSNIAADRSSNRGSADRLALEPIGQRRGDQLRAVVENRFGNIDGRRHPTFEPFRVVGRDRPGASLVFGLMQVNQRLMGLHPHHIANRLSAGEANSSTFGSPSAPLGTRIGRVGSDRAGRANASSARGLFYWFNILNRGSSSIVRIARSSPRNLRRRSTNGRDRDSLAGS